MEVRSQQRRAGTRANQRASKRRNGRKAAHPQDDYELLHQMIENRVKNTKEFDQASVNAGRCIGGVTRSSWNVKG
jgi:hypothetical protein